GSAIPPSGAPSGAATRVSFDADGSYYYGVGSTFVYQHATSGGAIGFGGTVSPVAAYNGTGYFTTSDGNLHAAGNYYWTAALTGGSCGSAPAVAKNIVYAAGC